MAKGLDNLRIGNLEFMKASYLCREPSMPSYDIVLWTPNEYYGKEKDYVKLNKEYYCKPNNTLSRVHRSLFKLKETNMTIAQFYYDKDEDCYRFEYVGDRPLWIDKGEILSLFKLIKYGFIKLNTSWYDIEDINKVIEECKEEVK